MTKVLIVDDDAAFRHAAGALLRTRFPSVELREVGNGQEARQQLDGLDLLFIDISLAQENGLELAARIKSEYPGFAVAILTIHDAPEYRQAAFKQGADYFVSKGDAARRIVEVVRSVLDRTHAAVLKLGKKHGRMPSYPPNHLQLNPTVRIGHCGALNTNFSYSRRWACSLIN